LTPGVTALGTAEKTDLALIGSTKLTKPPDRQIVLALGALDLNSGHGFNFMIFVVDNGNLIFDAFFSDLHLVSAINLADIAALPALQLTSG
jgi:hypothetical protein